VAAGVGGDLDRAGAGQLQHPQRLPPATLARAGQVLTAQCLPAGPDRVQGVALGAVQSNHSHPGRLALAASQLTAASVLLAIAASLTALQPVTLTPQVTLSVLTLGLLGTGAAYVLNCRLIADQGPTAASTVPYLLPVVALTLGIVVLKEAISWTLFAGTALVLLGIAISERRLPSISRDAQRQTVTVDDHSDEA
jgi:drug/metabolite transporter (DMT)-like permease